VRKSPEERIKAAQILAEEVDACIRKRLVQAGWSFHKVSRAPWLGNCPDARVWSMTVNGIQMGSMSVWSHGTGAKLMVRVNSKVFCQDFFLTNTVSPRRISCLLMQWLKCAEIRQVMLG
jgi:hypothetical protein